MRLTQEEIELLDAIISQIQVPARKSREMASIIQKLEEEKKCPLVQLELQPPSA